MGGVTNVGSTNNNSGVEPKKKPEGKKKEPQVSAFDSYKQFKQQVETEYKDFQAQTKKEYEDYKNAVLGRTDSENGQIYKAHEGEQPPIMNKPKTAPVYNPEQEAGGEAVKGKIAADPLEGVKDVGPVEFEEDDSVQNNKPQETEQIPMKDISRNGVTGKYNISPGEDGTGFSLQTDMTISGGGEAKKFFIMNGKKGNEIWYDKNTGLYTFRGVSSHRQSFLNNKISLVSNNVSVSNAIYNDLLAKEKNGTELTDAEKNFKEYHIKNLEKYNLGIDESGNLIDKTE